MVGHSFGLASAVYNYNRRSAATNEILVTLFNTVISPAFLVAQKVHWLLRLQEASADQQARDPGGHLQLGRLGFGD